MKRKFGDRANWRRITRRGFACRYVESREFSGYITLYTIYGLKEPLWKSYGRHTYRIADKGYSWLQYFPKDSHYIVTAMFDERQNIIQWYIDTCKVQGVTDQGVPWFDDLYLDVVVLWNGEVFLLDEDELEEALERGDISDSDYNLAWSTARRIMQSIDAHAFPFFTLSLKHRAELFHHGEFRRKF
ncbi:putative RNA-binding protein associated with RNAse of E/G family [Paenibacillus forsythiae]|uniref:RNA-binding protein associated with RNAse of E/G family n=1 Tax=Paenibacillus forsythiae TaxID=365616 RepID=A0ABU3H1G8_9BACL|nr:DUF402 domain-containing protein [Paenibacillus forsythiae]MDT3424658.1 putative RNA-binding protein associated with RNAse of E/G family [Paenibacillus forsythiae]